MQFDNRGRVTSLTDGSVYSFSLGFAPDSNILTGNDSVNGNWTYAYDDFSRLSTSSKSGQAFNYKYDRFGNRWQQNVTAGSGPAPQFTFDANNHIVGDSYDAAGNITYDGIASYLYDPEGRMIYVAPLSGSAATYTYDASGRRVQSAVGSSTTDYLYDQSGRAITKLSSAGWLWSELYAGGLHVATYSFSTTTFNHADWLGTSRSHSNVSGGQLNMVQGLPFGDGQTLANPDWSAFHFTGQEWDSESNLTHFMFRQYSSTQGRWMMPDPAGLAASDPSNPQTWNRYAYVGNRPLNSVDPLGLDAGCDQFFDVTCGPCDPSFDFGCQPSPDPCDYYYYCGPSHGGGGSSSGGGGPSPAPRIGGKWPNGETLGLPRGLNLKPMGLAELIGLSPGTSCDFGVCVTIANSALGGAVSSGISLDPGFLRFLTGIPFFLFRKTPDRNLLESNCGKDIAGQPILTGSWGKINGCILNDNQLVPPGGTCFRAPSGTACLSWQENGCSQTLCPANYRGVNCSTNKFSGPFGVQSVGACVIP